MCRVPKDDIYSVKVSAIELGRFPFDSSWPSFVLFFRCDGIGVDVACFSSHIACDVSCCSGCFV